METMQACLDSQITVSADCFRARQPENSVNNITNPKNHHTNGYGFYKPAALISVFVQSRTTNYKKKTRDAI